MAMRSTKPMRPTEPAGSDRPIEASGSGPHKRPHRPRVRDGRAIWWGQRSSARRRAARGRAPRRHDVALIAIAITLIAGACSVGKPVDSEATGATTSVPIVATSSVVGGPGDESAAPATTTAAPTTTITTTTTIGDDPTGAILAAYLGFWDTWLAANDPPDPDHPGLKRYYTGPAYDNAVERITTFRIGGFQVRLPSDTLYRHDPAVEEISPDATTAFVTDCSVDDGIISVIATGEILNDEIVTVMFRTELRKVNGEWRVFDNKIVGRWQGSVPCAE